MVTRDTAAFAEFVAARSAALHRAAYLMVGDVGLAQDLVQEALTKTYVAWPRLRDKSNAEAYTRKAITTTAISWFRRKGWSAERATDRLPERATAAHDDRVAQSTWLWECLQQLPVRQRAAIVLRYYHDYDYATIAEILGTTSTNVGSTLSRALDRLRMDLEPNVESALSAEQVR